MCIVNIDIRGCQITRVTTFHAHGAEYKERLRNMYLQQRSQCGT